MTTGLERRDEGWSAVQAADVAVDRGYGYFIRYALDDLIASGRPFTSDHVADRAQQYAGDQKPHSPNLIGSIIGTAARAGRITRTGNRRRSTHPSRHAAYNAEWKAT